jgi:hypothetical protein
MTSQVIERPNTEYRINGHGKPVYYTNVEYFPQCYNL